MPCHGKRIIKGFACDLLEVFVTLHRSETEREFKLFLSPYLRDTLCVTRNVMFELLPDTNRVYQRTIHIESQRFSYYHYSSPYGGTAGIDRLGAAMLIALVTITPIGLTGALPAMTQPLLLLAGIGVGICSSVIPYVCDQLAMARLPRATFALLLSLLPASAAVIGIIVLRQIPTLVEITGILLVAGGVALHQESEALPRNRKKSN
jgi:hypothetical protein